MNPYEFSKPTLKPKGQDPLKFILTVIALWYLFSRLMMD